MFKKRERERAPVACGWGSMAPNPGGLGALEVNLAFRYV